MGDVAGISLLELNIGWGIAVASFIYFGVLVAKLPPPPKNQ